MTLFLTDFTHCSGVPIADLEQVNSGWVRASDDRIDLQFNLKIFPLTQIILQKSRILQKSNAFRPTFPPIETTSIGPIWLVSIS